MRYYYEDEKFDYPWGTDKDCPDSFVLRGVDTVEQEDGEQEYAPRCPCMEKGSGMSNIEITPDVDDELHGFFGAFCTEEYP